MRVELSGIEITGEAGGVAPADGPGIAAVGPYEVDVRGPEPSELAPGGAGVSWTVANRGDAPLHPTHVRLVFRLIGAPAPLRFFRHGYQSWSPSGVATFGIDRDPSTEDRCFRFVRDVYLGDPDRVESDDELRSELVTLLGGSGGPWHLLGFTGATEHDGTLRLRRATDGSDSVELVAEAFFGGAEIPPGTQRSLHGLVLMDGDDPSTLLESWAGTIGRVQQARTTETYQVGWCSWYHYFHEITEDALRANLACAGDWPFAVFQLDDGYQSQIGDWLTATESFPSGVEAIAADIADAGYRPGLWLAPFLAAPASAVAAAHPDWLVRSVGGDDPLLSWFNPPWGGGMWGLDTTHPEVQDHLASTAAALVEVGYTYLKLDFTFSPGLAGRFADPTMTPAQRVRAGYDAVRRGAGDGTFLLGCGAPLGPCIGVVDGMRIGADVAPSWEPKDAFELPGLTEVLPATRHAYACTLTRAFQHRRLWLNDPDCVMLRNDATDLSHAAARTWAHTVAVSGGMALVSDDLALLGADARALLTEVLEIGRAADAQAAAGAPARCPDLMDANPPTTLTAAGHLLLTDPTTATSTFTHPT
jgi:alpha-galactosidase